MAEIFWHVCIASLPAFQPLLSWGSQVSLAFAEREIRVSAAILQACLEEKSGLD